MPNHVTTILKISGEGPNIEKCLYEIKSEEGYVIDFRNIIPMPIGLQSDSVDSIVEGLVNYAFGEKSYLIRGLKEITDKQWDEFIKMLSCKRKYGYCSWYDWSIANWGTKWNSYNGKLVEPNIIRFQTAWSFPIPVMRELSKKYPNLTFDCTYADEDTGANAGKFVFVDGCETCRTPPDGSREAYDIAFEVCPEERENYELVGDNYKYIDEDA